MAACSSVCCTDSWAGTATHCNTLQHTAKHCNTLQYTATYCNTFDPLSTWLLSKYCNTLQYTATHCNTLQHNRACVDMTPKQVQQHTATHCNTLQHTATQSSVCRLDSRVDTIKTARFLPKIPHTHTRTHRITNQIRVRYLRWLFCIWHYHYPSPC